MIQNNTILNNLISQSSNIEISFLLKKESTNHQHTKRIYEILNRRWFLLGWNRVKCKNIWRNDGTLDELLAVEELGFMFLKWRSCELVNWGVKSDFTPFLLFLTDVYSPRRVVPSPRRVKGSDFFLISVFFMKK